MNVKELKEYLDQYPDEMEVVLRLESDYQIINEFDIDIIKGVHKSNSWVMRARKDDINGKDYLLIG